jgi:hypothetical protein
MAAEFKIGRLRYNWAGNWAPATTYGRDDVVLKDGKAYTCLVPNTSSANFYTDLYNIFPRWSLVIDGKTWAGPWVTNYSYGVGHIVLFGGKAYNCITAHTSSTFLSNAANWEVYAEFAGWNNAWATSVAYGVNDIVKYGGIVYKCIANHVSAGSASSGLEANQASWTVYFSGVEYKGVWVASTRYKVNDLVKVDGNIYRCSTYNSDSLFVPASWTLWIPGQQFNYAWSSTTNYQIGDVVTYGGTAYISKTANNLAGTPSSDSVGWAVFNVGYRYRNTWASLTTYFKGDVVRQGGMLYEAIADNSQSPSASTVSTNYVRGTQNNIFVTNGANIKIGMIASASNIVSGQVVSSVDILSATCSSVSISASSITISSYTTKTAASYSVTFAIPSQLLAPTTNVSYVVSGNSNTAYNGTFTASASTTTSITFSSATTTTTTPTGTILIIIQRKSSGTFIFYMQCKICISYLQPTIECTWHNPHRTRTSHMNPT